MPVKGEVLENPVTKERVTFLETSASSNNELLKMEAINLADGFNNINHIHPTQEETHHVISGTMGVEKDGKTYTLKDGDSISFPPMVPHKFWNAGKDGGKSPIHFITEFRPAYDTEIFIETYIALARDGKSTKKGRPPILQFFVILHDHPIAGYAAKAPIWLQKIVISILAFIGRLFGYAGTYK
jgi:quercetin dioxygenase-like cupin family protein